MVSFPNSAVRAVCTGLAPQLKGVPASLDAGRVMLAIAAVESGGNDPNEAGNDCDPRHEPAYDAGGGFYNKSAIQRSLVALNGSGAACSYGPWQMMFCNFAPGTTIGSLGDLNALALNFVRWFNICVPRHTPSNLDEIGEIWNSGTIRPDPAYVAKLAQAYAATGDPE